MPDHSRNVTRRPLQRCISRRPKSDDWQAATRG